MSNKKAIRATIRRDSPQANHNPDHIDYTEHILRRTVQRSPLRSNYTNIPPNVKHDFYAYKDNLSLYLHKRTAQLKRNNPTSSAGSRPLRNLYLDNPDDKLNRILPKVIGDHTARVLDSDKDIRIPTDGINRKILQQLEDEKPIDYFVYESHGEHEKKSHLRLKTPPKSVSPDQRVEQIIARNLKNEQIDKFYSQYSQRKTARNVKRLKLSEAQDANLDEACSDQSVFSYKNPLAFKFFVTDQGDIMSVIPEGDKKSKQAKSHDRFLKTARADDLKLVDKVCLENNLQIGQFFSMSEKEFNMKYHNTNPRSKSARNRIEGSIGKSSPEKKMRTFGSNDPHENLKGLTEEEVDLKKILVDDEFTKNRKKDFVHDKVTMNKRDSMAVGATPLKPQIIMQTRYKSAFEVGSRTKKSTKETTFTKASKESLGKEVKNFGQTTTGEKITFSEWANEIVRAIDLGEQEQKEKEEERPRPESQERKLPPPLRINLGVKEISNFQALTERQTLTSHTARRLTPSTDIRTSRQHKSTLSLDFQSLSQNSKSNAELKQVFNNFCNEVRNVQVSNQNTNEKLAEKINNLESKFDREYQGLQSFDKKVFNFVPPKQFRTMEKKNTFKRLLVACLTERILDKRGLLEDYEKKRREHKILDLHHLANDYTVKQDQN